MRHLVFGLCLIISSASLAGGWETWYSYYDWAISTNDAPAREYAPDFSKYRDGTVLRNQFASANMKFEDRNDYVFTDAHMRRMKIQFLADGVGIWSEGQIRIKFLVDVVAVFVSFPISLDITILDKRGRRLHSTPTIGRRMETFLDQVGDGTHVTPVPLEVYEMGITGGNKGMFREIIFDNPDGPTYIDDLVVMFAPQEGSVFTGCLDQSGRMVKKKNLQFVQGSLKRSTRSDSVGCFEVENLKPGIWTDVLLLAGKKRADLSGCWTDNNVAMSRRRIEFRQPGGRWGRIRTSTDLAGCFHVENLKSGKWIRMIIR